MRPRGPCGLLRRPSNTLHCSLHTRLLWDSAFVQQLHKLGTEASPPCRQEHEESYGPGGPGPAAAAAPDSARHPSRIRALQGAQGGQPGRAGRHCWCRCCLQVLARTDLQCIRCSRWSAASGIAVCFLTCPSTQLPCTHGVCQQVTSLPHPVVGAAEDLQCEGQRHPLQYTCVMQLI